jgi:TonB family protein
MGMSEFREMLLEHLRRYKVWPESFEALGIQGKAYVSCRIDGFTGELIDYRIWRSSGHAEIDQAAVSTLKRSSPFPPIGTPGTLYLDLVLQYDDQELQGI